MLNRDFEKFGVGRSRAEIGKREISLDAPSVEEDLANMKTGLIILVRL
jgi:hypothetical protein